MFVRFFGVQTWKTLLYYNRYPYFSDNGISGNIFEPNPMPHLSLSAPQPISSRSRDFYDDFVPLPDEDTRHSTGSFQSVSDCTPPTHSFSLGNGKEWDGVGRSHVTTPCSEILCKTEDITPELCHNSQSLPAPDINSWSWPQSIEPTVIWKFQILKTLIIILLIFTKKFR